MVDAPGEIGVFMVYPHLKRLDARIRHSNGSKKLERLLARSIQEFAPSQF